MLCFLYKEPTLLCYLGGLFRSGVCFADSQGLSFGVCFFSYCCFYGVGDRDGSRGYGSWQHHDDDDL